MVFTGYAVSAVGVLISFESFFAGLVLIFFGSLIFLPSRKITLDLPNNLVADKTWYWFLSAGTTLPLDKYKAIVLQKKRMRYTVYSRANHPNSQLKVYYEVFAMTENHMEKQLIYRATDIPSAKAKAQELSQWLKLPIEHFSPRK